VWTVSTMKLSSEALFIVGRERERRRGEDIIYV